MPEDGLFKRGAIWWTRLGGKRVSTGCKDREAARLWRAERERERADPAYAAAHGATVDDVIAAWMAEVRAQTKKKRADGTIDMHACKSGHLSRVFAAMTPPRVRLGDVTATAVDSFIETRLAEGAARTTVAKELGTLRLVLAYAKRRAMFPFDLDAVMPDEFEAEYVPRKRWLTDDELVKLLAAFDAHPEIGMMEPRHDLQAWILWTIATGSRWSESVRAERRDVDLEAGLVLVRGTKTKASARTIPIVSVVRALLEEALRLAPGTGEGRLFGWEPEDRPRVWRSLAAACKRAEIPRVSANDLRRTLSSWLVQRGSIPAHVGKLLGHTTGRMVEIIYGQMTPEALGGLLEERVGSVPAHPHRTASRAATAARSLGKTRVRRLSAVARRACGSGCRGFESRRSPKVFRVVGRVAVSNLYRSREVAGVEAGSIGTFGELLDGALGGLS